MMGFIVIFNLFVLNLNKVNSMYICIVVTPFNKTVQN